MILSITAEHVNGEEGKRNLRVLLRWKTHNTGTLDFITAHTSEGVGDNSSPTDTNKTLTESQPRPPLLFCPSKSSFLKARVIQSKLNSPMLFILDLSTADAGGDGRLPEIIAIAGSEIYSIALAVHNAYLLFLFILAQLIFFHATVFYNFYLFKILLICIYAKARTMYYNYSCCRFKYDQHKSVDRFSTFNNLFSNNICTVPLSLHEKMSRLN